MAEYGVDGLLVFRRDGKATAFKGNCEGFTLSLIMALEVRTDVSGIALTR